MLLQVNQQRKKDWKNVGLLLDGAGVLVTKHLEKTKIFSPFFALVLVNKTGFQESYSSQTYRRKF